jgi:16S rRNA (guanine527-N7)-methyltransferase
MNIIGVAQSMKFTGDQGVNLEIKTFTDTVKSLIGLQLTREQVAALKTYETELLKWNERISLTAIRDAEGVRVKHFLDSLTVLLAWERGSPPSRLIDVGAGAGFPGLVLKLIWPGTQVTLVESIHKKADFCHHMVERLSLKDVMVVPKRAETVGQDLEHRASYDLAVARAVARMPILMEYLLPLVHRNGVVMAMKGETAPAETHTAEKAIQVLGGRVKKLFHVELPGVVEERFIVLVEKVAQTPDKFPRRSGVPAKAPLA